MTNKSKTNKKVTVPTKKINLSLVIFLAFLVGCSILGAFLIFGTSAAPRNTATPPAVTLSLKVSNTRVSVGQVVPVSVILDTAGKTINAVQADITYPADKFEFVSMDATNSAFGIEAQGSGSSGLIKIARGSITAVSGSGVSVATVNLRAISSARKASLAFASSSQVMTTPDAVNVLAKTTGIQLSVQ